jgi:hypothetical protein
MKKSLIASSIMSAAVLVATSAFADDAVNIQSYSSGASVTWDNASGAYPVVTSILSVPGVTVNGYVYGAKGGTFLAADSTGGLEVYGFLSSMYTPVVGNSMLLTGTYDPFDSIPEVTTNTTISGYGPSTVTVEGTGLSAPAGIGTLTSPKLETIPVLAGQGSSLSTSVAAQVLQLDNVTISGQTAGEKFSTNDVTFTITDGSANTMSLFYYPHDFSIANQNLYGLTIPTGPVDIEGIVDYFPSGGYNEFIPLAIVVPEPGTLALCGAGALLALAFRSRKTA